MTTRASRDWKVSASYRILIRIGWAVTAVAVYFATAAAILDSIGVWWIVVGLAGGVLLLGSSLPEPVPRGYIIDGRSKVDPLRRF